MYIYRKFLEIIKKILEQVLGEFSSLFRKFLQDSFEIISGKENWKILHWNSWNG